MRFAFSALLHFVLFTSLTLTAIIARAELKACEALFRPSSTSSPLSAVDRATLTSVHEQLTFDRHNLEQAIASLHFDSKTLVPGGRLGSGVSGVVLRGHLADREVAIKIIHDAGSKELTDAVVIQHAFARLGFAPAILGEIGKAESIEWMNANGLAFPTDFPISKVNGILVMELTSTRTLKNSTFRKIHVTEDQQLLLARDAALIEAVGTELGVTPVDVDAVIAANGRLQLLDLSFFHFRRLTDMVGWKRALSTLVEYSTMVVH